MIKDLLVPLFGTDDDSRVLRLAQLAAKPFAAHLDCVHVKPGPREMAMATSTVEAAGMITQTLWDALEEESRALEGHARTAFESFWNRFAGPACEEPPAQAGRITASFRCMMGDRLDLIARTARTHELTVLGRDTETTVGLSTGQIGNVLMRSGRPLLLAPQRERDSLGTRIAIAWKDSAESARAITAAMPFILNAQKILILGVAESAKDEATATESVARLKRELEWHGIQPETQIVASEVVQPTRSILNSAEAWNADLLVMGAYGHSRLEEFVFGGFTRDVLRNASLPVFLFH
jgi:nucleotide-binding universal stress UspA family protein